MADLDGRRYEESRQNGHKGLVVGSCHLRLSLVLYSRY